ncbi:hypothetical protein [Arthrobacter woluwensis]|uniref:hypothetical protein n=1 Tax=Arthrobacter woluwensis TaxID=156980 RepID=UPI0011A4A927|nr:hypothetical protein [Arthrobacter woluwensis]
MPATERGFVYPSPTDAPDGPYSFQRLAEAMEAHMDSFTRTTYPLNAAPNGYSASGGVVVDRNPAGGRAALSMAITRTGANIALTASASLSGLGTLLPTEVRVPGLAQYKGAVFSGAGMNNNAHVYLDIAGGIIQFRVQENFSWNQNGTLYIYSDWSLPTP